jgi:cell wall assembly regulator SMI1
MDNLAAHKSAKIEKLIQERGCQLLFLPGYSPDFSPIEETFSKFKTFLRRVGARTREALYEAIGQALLTITAQDAASAGFAMVGMNLRAETKRREEAMTNDVFQTMQSIWKRIETQLLIEAWFAKMPAETALRDFQPGATEDEIQNAEIALGIVFPEDVKASYRIHNGNMWLGDFGRFCSLEEVVSFWNMMKPYAAGRKEDLAKDGWLDGTGQPVLVRAETWNIRWIPLLESNGTMTCLDLAPTPYGFLGQIIGSDPEEGTYHGWVAPSWQAFLSTFADDLEAGEYCYEEGELTWS